MAKSRVTRRQLLVAAAPALAAVPAVKLALGETDASAAEREASHAGHDHARLGHAAMIGAEVPAPGGPHDLDSLLYPPPPVQGDVARYEVVAVDREWEVAQGVTFPAWTYALRRDGVVQPGTVPGPIIRATEGQRLQVELTNASPHPHTIHFHGIHPANMDGVFEIVETGGTFTYDFPARPAGFHLYHCHATPLKKHIHRGLYGAFIIDPPGGRPPAQELVMVMNGFDTDGDGENNFYTVNGKAFYYAKYPIRVSRSQTVRIYLANLTEFDLVNSFHLHGDFFRYYPNGTTDTFEYTDTVVQTQGQRGIIEIDFANSGLFMFHAHQSEFAELGWMGFFDVVDGDVAQPASYGSFVCDPGSSGVV